jgi:hypothetical protein
MKQIQILLRARWTIRAGYADARLSRDEVGWHYARALKIGRFLFWEPRWLCALLAGRDLLRRIAGSA